MYTPKNFIVSVSSIAVIIVFTALVNKLILHNPENNLLSKISAIEKTTSDLNHAMRHDNRIQGVWGEHVLEELLEAYGFIKDISYFSQKTYVSYKGKTVKPDIVVHLKHTKLVIDAKMSISSYFKYTESPDSTTANMYLKNYASNVVNNILLLSRKQYTKYVDGAVDVTVMFVPIESAYITLLKYNPQIITKGVQKNTIICSPSTIIGVIKAVQYSCEVLRQEKPESQSSTCDTYKPNNHAELKAITEELNTLKSRISTMRACLRKTEISYTDVIHTINEIDDLCDKANIE